MSSTTVAAATTSEKTQAERLFQPFQLGPYNLRHRNGYLLDQFLNSETNRRADQYGGPIENRSRLLLEVVDQVSEIWRAERVGVRISPLGALNDIAPPHSRRRLQPRNCGGLAAAGQRRLDRLWTQIPGQPRFAGAIPQARSPQRR
jgi:NADH:flavin oxidoreductase / NADH oxidase family